MGQKKIRRALIICVVIDIALIITLFAWSGKRNYPKFLDQQFLNYSFGECVGHCISDIVLISLARVILLSLVYIFGQIESWIPFLVISLIVTLSMGAEFVYILVTSPSKNFTGPVIVKLILLCVNIFVSWTEFLVYMLVKFRSKKYRSMGYRIFEVRERGTSTTSNKGHETPSFSPFFKEDRYESKNGTPKILSRAASVERLPLLNDSIERSNLLKVSSSVEDRYKRYYGVSNNNNINININNNNINNNDISPSTSITSSSFSDSQRKPMVLPSIPRFVGLMIDNRSGMRISDKVHKKKTYNSCFSGKEGVEWTIQTLKDRISRREDAVLILQKLLDSNYIISLNGDRYEDNDNIFYTYSDELINDQLPVAKPLVPVSIKSIEDETEKQRKLRELAEQEERDRLIEEKLREEEEKKRIEEENRIKEEEERLEREEQQKRDEEEKKKQERILLAQEQLRLEEERHRKLMEEQQEQQKQQETQPQENPENTPKKVSPLMRNFVKEMRDPNKGISIKDRIHHLSATEFTTFERCFVGTEFVDWLVNNKNLYEREHAVKIGQKMNQAGLFHSVNHNLPLLDGFYFYRFKEDD